MESFSSIRNNSFLDNDTDVQCEEFGKDMDVEFVKSQKRNCIRLVEEQINRLKHCAPKQSNHSSQQGTRNRTKDCSSLENTAVSNCTPSNGLSKTNRFRMSPHHSSASDSECESARKGRGKRVFFSDKTPQGTPKSSCSQINLPPNPCSSSKLTSPCEDINGSRGRHKRKPVDSFCNKRQNEFKHSRRPPIASWTLKTVLIILVLILLGFYLARRYAYRLCTRAGYCVGCSADGSVRCVLCSSCHNMYKKRESKSINKF